MPVVIKICGLTTPEALDAALEAGADMVGFVFFAASPRHLEFETARAIGARVRGSAIKVALSVDASDDELAASIAALAPDMLQLHGEETPERVAAVRARFGLPVMKALPIAERADLAAVRRYDGVADRLIFDARAPRAATRPGGLDADNVAEALRITGAPGVDVSSGVERAPGEKDLGKIRTFVGRAREAADRLAAPDRMLSRA